MKPEYITLLAGFLGTVLGAIVSLATTWLQQRAQQKREQSKLALDAAIKDYESAEKYAEFMAKQGKALITYDLAYYIVLHNHLVQALSGGRSLTKEMWVTAHAQAYEISQAAVHFHQQRKASESVQENEASQAQ